MNCDDIRQHWNLYHDSEGDPELHFQIREHLDGCTKCAEWFGKQEWLERGIVDRLRDGAVDEPMWQRILSTSGVETAASRRRFPSWLGALAATIVLAFTGIHFLDKSSRGAELTALAGTLHSEIEAGRQRLGFVSDSDEQAEQYFRERAPFPVRCPPRKDAGFQVRGGGMCALSDQRTAFLVGEVDDREVSVLVLANSSIAAFSDVKTALRQGRRYLHADPRGFRMMARLIDRNVVVVVGRVDDAKLDRLLSAYGSYPEAAPVHRDGKTDKAI